VIVASVSLASAPHIAHAHGDGDSEEGTLDPRTDLPSPHDKDTTKPDLRPVELPYGGGRIPTGYSLHLSKTPRRLLSAGLSIHFSGVVTGLLGASTWWGLPRKTGDPCTGGCGRSYGLNFIPVAGPWITVAAYPHDPLTPLYIGAGAMQAIGLTLILASATNMEKRLYLNDKKSMWSGIDIGPGSIGLSGRW
jgi:hypothetical protein